MKRKILALMVAVLAAMHASAEAYDALWKQALAAQQKDLPKTELSVLRKIIDKAMADHSYGHLLSAELRSVALLGNISSDSIAPAVRRLEKLAAETGDATQAAVWNAALGKLYKQNAYQIPINEDEQTGQEGQVEINGRRQREYFAKALENPALLAGQASVDYAPLTVMGFDGSSFRHDMLHVVGFEADSNDAYRLMHDYYQKVGNRGAACLCAFRSAQINRGGIMMEMRKSKYLNTIDSLIHVYQDVPEAGELAVEYYRFMEGSTDAKPIEKLNYINYALSRWGGWSRMNVLRNAQKRLTEPSFHTREFPMVMRPSQKAWLVMDQIRNVGSLTLKITRINITADNNYDVNDAAVYKMLMKQASTLHQMEQTKRYVGHPEYEVLKDSFEIAGLPVGAYLMELACDNASMPPVRQLFYVSDLALMAQQLPDDTRRYVVVNATTGLPIAGAQICFYSDEGDGKRTVHARLTTDVDGEAVCKKVDGEALVTTSADKYMPARYVYLSRQRYYEQKRTFHQCEIYTDRSIYRPGQSVHVTAICFTVDKGKDTKAEGGKEVRFSLRDYTNGKMVGEKVTTTDEYGTASVDFELPQNGPTGLYTIYANDGTKRIRVEEYKRPTFEVTFPKVNQKYEWGDTLVVKATAKTYAGVPVQGGKVSYVVTRRSQMWWRNGLGSMQVKDGTAITREDGTFDVEIPLVTVGEGESLDEFMRVARFFSFDVEAIVTDLGGESQQGEMSLPLGTKPTLLSVDLPRMIECDSLRLMTLNYRNSSGMDIASTVDYRIDDGLWEKAAANVPVDLGGYVARMESGKHTLTAICEQDTLKHEFVTFSMDDHRPATQMTEWKYQTAEMFPRDGKPVYVQIGSSEENVHIVYSMIAGNKILEKGAWNLSDSIMTRAFTYQEAYETGVVLNYGFVKDGVCYTQTMQIGRPMPDKQLNMSWKTFRNRLTPGQKEEWTLQVTTSDGKPAKAQLLSVLYDKSLDQIEKHLWTMNLGLYQNLPSSYWRHNLGVRPFALAAHYPTKFYDQKELEVDGFDAKFFNLNVARNEVMVVGYGSSRTLSRVGSVTLQKHSAAVPEAAMAFEATPMLDSMGTTESESAVIKGTLDNVTVRENLKETAFFYPALETDAEGNVGLRFTLPESITTWKFMGLAHDQDMRNGLLMDEAVAKKVVMVQPNMPRFIREGDKAQIVTKIFNTSDKKVSGHVRMQLIDPETNKVAWQRTQKYTIEANGTSNVSFDMEKLVEGIYINKVVAMGDGYSDGEQHYLPVLSNRELVTNTLPFTLHGVGEKNLDLTSLFLDKNDKQSMDGKDARLTIEYTANPSWLMVQALPSIASPSVDDANAISLMAAVYSNGIARHIMKQSPVIRQVVEVWKQEKGNDGTTLMSSLEKNQDLKNLVLKETPWVVDADKETEQKSRLVNYFDENEQETRLQNLTSKLKALQNSDGSFSWWKGMQGSRYMTTAVAEMMARLNKLVGRQTECAAMLSSALSFLQKQVSKEVKAMKAEEAKKHGVMPSEEALHYLYILSLDDTKLDASAEADKAYLLKKMADKTCSFTIYGKARAAVILASSSYKAKAAEYLQSIDEYAVYKEDMGRYYDTPRAYYSWNDYRIPTQVAAIEAMQMLCPDKRQAIEDMQRWLLQSKRTQGWDTPVNTVNAVYAFMKGNDAVLGKEAEASMRLDGVQLVLPKATAGLGYVKTSKAGIAKTLTIEKKDGKTSWGAVYAQYAQPLDEIASGASGISVKRVVVAEGSPVVGQKVRVSFIVTADRDYDFVQMVDKRAGCLEPVNQTSGYCADGYYVSPRDYATIYCFDRLPKGTCVVSTEYYVGRKGNYQSGICTVQCAYSPEFAGRAVAYRMEIKE